MMFEENNEVKRLLHKKLLELMKKSKSNIEEKRLGEVIEISNTEEFIKILASDKPVVIDFWAPWCPPCLMFKPIFEKIAKEFSNKLIFVKVNVDENPDIAAQYGISAIPTIMMVYKQQVICVRVGFMDELEFKAWINECLKKLGY